MPSFKVLLPWVIVAVVVVFSLFLESPRSTFLSLVGRVVEDENGTNVFGQSNNGLGMYNSSVKDIFIMAVLHVPVRLLCHFVQSRADRYLRRQFSDGSSLANVKWNLKCGVVLLVTLLFNVCVLIKEKLWNDLQMWWDGVPNGHMPFWLKLCSLWQITVFLCQLENFGFCGMSFKEICNAAAPVTLNFIFSTSCYVMNFTPLQMIMFIIRIVPILLICAIQIISVADLTRDHAIFVLKLSQYVHTATLMERAAYIMLALGLIVSSERAGREMAFVVMQLNVLFTASILFENSRRKRDVSAIQRFLNRAITSSASTPMIRRVARQNKGKWKAKSRSRSRNLGISSLPGLSTSNQPSTSTAN